MISKSWFASLTTVVVLLSPAVSSTLAQELKPLKYNTPGLKVDLGVGLWAWPLPMDWDADGDLDLLVSCPDKPMSGTYFFENDSGSVKMPTFKPGIKVGPGMKNPQVSYVNGEPHVLDSNLEFVDFLGKDFQRNRMKALYEGEKIRESKGNQRFNVWSYADFDGDGAADIVIGADDWGYYGWDEGYDSSGVWKMGPLHGYVYILRNEGTTDQPKYANPQALEAAGEIVNVFGNPMPNFADFDGDGDLDLLCAEFLDGFTYFQNLGTRTQPEYARGEVLGGQQQRIHMHVQMITPTAIDWDRDGDADIVCGDEDGRVALIENTGTVANGQPVFLPPAYFQQYAEELKFGALVTPVSFDWDADGDEDLVCGNTSGNVAWFENLCNRMLQVDETPQWAPPQLIHAAGKPIHVQAGLNGSIQGPAEAKWGYTTLSIADWNQDALPDLVINSIWGKAEWFENVGSRQKPEFAEKKSVEVAWLGEPPKPKWTWWTPEPTQLATQWRTTPVVIDWDQDGLNDLVMLDHEGYLAWFQRERRGDALVLLPGKRVFNGAHYTGKHATIESTDKQLRLNSDSNGASGRRKLCIVDWDGDGRRDIIVNTINANWLRNVTGGEVSNGGVSGDGQSWEFADQGNLAERVLAGHTTSPTTVDWDGDGKPALLLGAEDGRIYYQKR